MTVFLPIMNPVFSANEEKPPLVTARRTKSIRIYYLSSQAVKVQAPRFLFLISSKAVLSNDSCELFVDPLTKYLWSLAWKGIPQEHYVSEKKLAPKKVCDFQNTWASFYKCPLSTEWLSREILGLNGMSNVRTTILII